MNLKDKKVLLVGLAKTGISTIKHLNKLGANVVVNDIKDVKPEPVTNSQSGLYQLSASKDGKKLAFSSLYKSSFNIFLLCSRLLL